MFERPRRGTSRAGSAVASNCVPYVIFPIREARDRGLTNSEIMEPSSPDKLKQVPAGLTHILQVLGEV
jgi:hypothetical protein